MRYRDHRNRGITLTEVLVSSLLLIIAIIPILKGMTVATVDTKKIEHKTKAAFLAQEKLDWIKGKSVYDYTNGGSGWAVTGEDLGGGYWCNISQSYPYDPASEDLMQIQIEAGHNSSGNNVLVTLTSMIARRW